MKRFLAICLMLVDTWTLLTVELLDKHLHSFNASIVQVCRFC